MRARSAYKITGAGELDGKGMALTPPLTKRPSASVALPDREAEALVATAAKILVVGGMGNLVFGFITGAFMVRARIASPEVPRYLILTHLGALMWAPILLGLVWAVRLSNLTAWAETLAAGSLLGGSVGVDARDLLYWLQGVRDEFAERPAAFILGPISAGATATKPLILLIGVLQAP